jgi:hypothetical protein
VAHPIIPPELSRSKICSGVTDSVNRVAQSVQCLATGWTTARSRFDPWKRRKDFSCSSASRPALGPTQMGTMGTGGPFPGVKTRPGRDADHSRPSSAEVENE